MHEPLQARACAGHGMRCLIAAPRSRAAEMGALPPFAVHSLPNFTPHPQYPAPRPQVRRHKLEKWVNEPFFEETLKGCMVRAVHAVRAVLCLLTACPAPLCCCLCVPSTTAPMHRQGHMQPCADLLRAVSGQAWAAVATARRPCLPCHPSSNSLASQPPMAAHPLFALDPGPPHCHAEPLLPAPSAAPCSLCRSLCHSRCCRCGWPWARRWGRMASLAPSTCWPKCGRWRRGSRGPTSESTGPGGREAVLHCGMV